MLMERRRRMDEETVPFKKSIAGNDLFDRAVEGEDPTLATILLDTLHLVGAQPESLTPSQLGEVLPEVERRLRRFLDDDETLALMARLRNLLLAWE